MSENLDASPFVPCMAGASTGRRTRVWLLAPSSIAFPVLRRCLAASTPSQRGKAGGSAPHSAHTLEQPAMALLAAALAAGGKPNGDALPIANVDLSLPRTSCSGRLHMRGPRQELCVLTCQLPRIDRTLLELFTVLPCLPMNCLLLVSDCVMFYGSSRACRFGKATPQRAWIPARPVSTGAG